MLVWRVWQDIPLFFTITEAKESQSRQMGLKVLLISENETTFI